MVYMEFFQNSIFKEIPLMTIKRTILTIIFLFFHYIMSFLIMPKKDILRIFLNKKSIDINQKNA
jgi:hypothetical protein